MTKKQTPLVRVSFECKEQLERLVQELEKVNPAASPQPSLGRVVEKLVENHAADVLGKEIESVLSGAT